MLPNIICFNSHFESKYKIKSFPFFKSLVIINNLNNDMGSSFPINEFLTLIIYSFKSPSKGYQSWSLLLYSIRTMGRIYHWVRYKLLYFRFIWSGLISCLIMYSKCSNKYYFWISSWILQLLYPSYLHCYYNICIVFICWYVWNCSCCSWNALNSFNWINYWWIWPNFR